jgi:hypothetical protein
MKIAMFALFFFLSAGLQAQKQNYDLVNYTAPNGWSKEEKQTVITYTKTDNAKGSWCQISIVKSTDSKGSIEADFNSEWQELVVKPFSVKDLPQLSEAPDENGWKAKGGLAKFQFNKKDAIVMLTTMSGYQRCASIVATTNNQAYMSNIQSFLESVDMVKPAANTGTNKTSEPVRKTDYITATGFHFTTTNFDDGWTSTAQEDWVELSKGNIKVLLHYPKQGTIFPADPEPLTNAAWNILVAPRYRDLKNYKVVSPSVSYDRSYIGFGNAKDNTGKNVFLVFYRGGNSGWIEFIAPDKSSFYQAFGVNTDALDWNTSNTVLEPLKKMATYNRFALAPADLNGSWTNDFTGMHELYSVYTGQYAGTNMYQSSETFDFFKGSNYNWELIVVNGPGGAAKLTNVKNSGNCSVPNNWQINFSNIEGKPKTYDAYFSCIKGARILWMRDSQIKNGYSSYGLRK